MQALRFAWRFLLRDWRSGEIRVLASALLIAVAAVTSVGFFTDRVDRALHQQANDLLGADLIISADFDQREQWWWQQAQRDSVRNVQVLSFPSMLMGREELQLVMVKSVTEPYPLRGTLYISDQQFAADRPANGIPAPGELWLEPRLFSLLGVDVGDVIQLGEKQFSISAVITAEPGRGGDLFAVAPAVLMNQADLDATGLIQPGSRVRYNLMLAGDASLLGSISERLNQEKPRGVSTLDISQSRPEIRVALERADQFLGLAAGISVILAGVAIALAARRFAQRHLDHVALMRCFGAAQGFVGRVFFLQLILLALIAALLGSALGFMTHLVLIEVLGSMLGVNLPWPGITPLLIGVSTALITLLGFAMPPLMQLRNIPAMRVIRRELGQIRAGGLLAYAMGFAAMAALVLWQTADISLGLFTLAGILLALLVFVLIALVLLRVFRGVVDRLASGSARFGISHVTRHASSTLIQIVAFGLGLTVLLLLTVIRGDLLDDWKKTLPENTPNRFVINVKQDQLVSLSAFFVERKLDAPHFFPMVRARLMQINDRTVSAADYDSDRARRLVEREFNVSWSETLPSDNEIVQGQWLPVAAGAEQLSLEDGIAKTLGIALGDHLTFDVAGQEFRAVVSSIRKVNWDSFKPNFFVLTAPALLAEFPSTYMSSFYVPAAQHQLVNELVRQFPNITVFDVAAIMNHVREIISRVTLAVEYVFVFTLAAGLMVLYAAIQSTHDERLLENAIVKTLGGRRRQILNALIAEFASLGILAGVLAALLASAIAAVLADQVLSMPFYFDPTIILIGLFGGGFGILLAGIWGSRDVLRQAPLAILRGLN